MPDNIYELYEGLEKQQTMLCFKGALTEKLILVLLNTIERKMEAFEPSPKLRKRVFQVLTESLQNLKLHGREIESPNQHGDGIIVVARADEGYSVFTGNYMKPKEVGKLKNKLDQINQMDSDQLRAFYREVLDNGTFSDKGGGGLGIIDMARKSKRKLEYAFVPSDGESTFFSLNVNVSENS